LKPIEEFCKRGNNPSKYRSHCNSCRHIEGKAEYERRRDSERERHREYRIKNRESILAKEAELRKTNREQIRATRKRWEANNPDKIKAKNDRFKEKYPHYGRDKNRIKRAKNPELTRKEASDDHFKKMGVDQDWYDRTLAAQGYGCMICGRPDSGVTGKRFFIDHDHKCCGNTRACEKCRRGLLCLQCNVWIAGIEKYPRLAKRALWYLNKFARNIENNYEATQYSLFSE
jgi:hypothetical protein